MTTQSHTPTPWRVGDAGHTVFAPKGHSPLMVAQRVRPDDTAFIVRAVNAHDALVEALDLSEQLLNDSEVRLFISATMGEQAALHKALNKARKALNKARAALKLAKGE